MAKPPWSSGPGEILQHGMSLLRKDSDTNRRLAMLSIDNSVELMIKTYLGLPKRVTGLNIGRTKYAEFSESFPKLLDAIDEFASDRIVGIDLGEIEWYHRLRNQLYHQGNGLTVELERCGSMQHWRSFSSRTCSTANWRITKKIPAKNC